jgi:uncharacterized membrane protein YfcA
MSYDALAIVLVAIAVGSFFKGATGIGLPIIAIPTLAAFLGVQHAVVVITIPTFISNVWIVWRYRRMAAGIPHLPVSLLAAAAGTVLGAFVLAALTDTALVWLLIGWIAAYLLNLALNPDFRLQGRLAKYLSPVIATIAGLSQGATGISGPVVATWIHSYRLQAQVYVFGVSIMFLVIAFVHLVAVSGIGLMHQDRLWQGLLAIIPSLLFVQIGMWTTPHISPKWFNRMVIAIVIVMEAKLIWDVMGR